MNWLTTEEIKRRAAISEEEALNVSIEHWEQICEAIERGEELQNHFLAYECGLCQRRNYCKKECSSCILCSKGLVVCCQEWESFYGHRTLPNAQAMLNRLYMERGKRYGTAALPYKKECKKEKPALRHGDYGYSGEGSQRLFVKNFDGKKRYGYEEHLWPLSPKEVYGTLDEPGAVILGNIFDDLKRNAEDLEEFEVGAGECCKSIFKARYDGTSTKGGRMPFLLGNRDDRFWFTEKQVIEISQKLLQMVAYAKREQNSSYKK